jgi:hypothetical protein
MPSMRPGVAQAAQTPAQAIAVATVRVVLKLPLSMRFPLDDAVARTDRDRIVEASAAGTRIPCKEASRARDGRIPRD